MKQHGATDAARRPRLLIGPWAHGDSSAGSAGAATASRPTTSRSTRRRSTCAGSIATSRGSTTGVDDEPPVRLFIMGIDEWRDEQDWPLPDTAFTPFYLHSDGHANTAAGDGTLSTQAPGDEPHDTYLYDPRNPVPTTGGATFLPGLFVAANAGPRDQRPIDGRSDVLMLHHPAAGARRRGHRSDRARAVRLLLGARHRLHRQARRRPSRRSGRDPHRRHPARSLPRVDERTASRWSPARSTSCASTCGRPRTCSAPATASAWTYPAATSRASTATRTPARRSPTDGPRTSWRPSTASFTIASGPRTWCCRSSTAPEFRACAWLTTPVLTEVAQLQGIAVASVFQDHLQPGEPAFS